MERDGIKPFTVRLIDPKDKGFRALSQWSKGRNWGLRFTNPATGESFCRHLVSVSYLSYMDLTDGLGYFSNWRMLVMGGLIEKAKKKEIKTE